MTDTVKYDVGESTTINLGVDKYTPRLEPDGASLLTTDITQEGQLVAYPHEPDEKELAALKEYVKCCYLHPDSVPGFSLAWANGDMGKKDIITYLYIKAFGNPV